MATSEPPQRSLTPIGYGAFKIGRNRGTKYPFAYELPDDRTVDRLLNGVLDLGIGWIDTAPAYGLSEQRIGRAISHRRDEYVLSSKVGESFDDAGSRFDFSKEGVRTRVETSLRRLRTDRLDIVFVHCPHDDLPVLRDSDALETLQMLRDRGDVGKIGASVYTPQAIRYVLPRVDCLMVEYNLQRRELEEEIHEASRQGLTVVVKKGLASGHLDADQAVRFVLSHPGVAGLCVASLNLDHLREIVETARSVRDWSVA